jgi:two-component system, LuxR family, response regulator FixJ
MLARPQQLIFIIDNDPLARRFAEHWLRAAGFATQSFADGATALEEFAVTRPAGLLLDLQLDDMTGIDVLDRLTLAGQDVPTVLLSAVAEVRSTVAVMRLGAYDVLQKPADPAAVVESLRMAIARKQLRLSTDQKRSEVSEKLFTLSPRERDVARLMVAGQPNKLIARSLGISSRTVEIHRARVMLKTGAPSFAQFVRTFADELAA